MNIEQVALPYLQSLRDETGDSASLAVRSDDHILYVAHVSTSRQLRLGANVGTRFPLHTTSLGKVLMAFDSADTIQTFLARAPFDRRTEHTVTDPAALAERFAAIRSRGYDSALDELDYGIVSVAVPVFDTERVAVAAINCSTSTTRISQDELIRTRLPLLREAAGAIEAALRRWPVLAHSLRHG